MVYEKGLSESCFVTTCISFGLEHLNCLDHNQGGQSRGQHDGVHRFPEPMKSFITFLILSQVSCGKVQIPPHIFLHKPVSKFLLCLL